MKITVAINALNEEENLPLALRSVLPWADEIVVVDMHSEDRTVEIARKYGARVFFHEQTGFVEPARAFAIEKATGDWVLILDADELIPGPLSRRLLEIVAKDEADVVAIPRLNYLLGAPLMHTAWGPEQDRHARFFKKGMLRTSARIHGFPRPAPEARVLNLAYKPGLAIVHFNYVDTAQFIDKLNRYTSVEARQAFERGEKAGAGRALYRVAGEFVNRYLRFRGYRDGWRGLYLSGLMAAYRWATYAKLQELWSTGGREAIKGSYGREGERIVEGYGAEEEEVRREAGG